MCLRKFRSLGLYTQTIRDTISILSRTHITQMSSKPSPKLSPTIIPDSYTLTTPAESFPSPSRGQCTWHTLISSPQTPTSSLSVGIAVCPPLTGSLCPHRHSHAEVYHVLSGSGIVTVEGQDYKVAKGSSVFVPGDAEHGVRNESEEEFKWFYVFATDSFGDVVYRFTGEMEAEQVGDGKSKQGKGNDKADKSWRWLRKVKMALGF